MTSTGLERVVVIGCGLIGTSIALALTRAGVRVALDDIDVGVLDQARRMGAGTVLTEDTPVADLVVIATPPSAVVDTLYDAQVRGLGRAYTDVAGAKEQIWTEAELRGSDVLGYVPGHPMAGRELSGPGAAQADLFAGRPWILCPYPTVEPDALDAVDALVFLCGARRTDLTPAAHDRAVAVLSHVPQLVSSVLAAQLADLGPAMLALAGTGVRDTTRIAGSDPRMWADILGQNAPAVAEEVERMAGDLASAAAELRRLGAGGSATVVAGLLHRGNAGRAALLDADAVTEATPAVPVSPAPARVVPPQESVRRHGLSSFTETLMAPGQPGVRYRTPAPAGRTPGRPGTAPGPDLPECTTV